jgi:hypothetical protein
MNRNLVPVDGEVVVRSAEQHRTVSGLPPHEKRKLTSGSEEHGQLEVVCLQGIKASIDRVGDWVQPSSDGVNTMQGTSENECFIGRELLCAYKVVRLVDEPSRLVDDPQRGHVRHL